MTSESKLEANRANAQKSTGPLTEAGKANSRLNAIRHGLTSQVACMTWEDRDAFNQFCAAIVAEYRTEGVIETQLAQSIAEDHWRLNRVRAIENNIFALGFATATIKVDSVNPQIDAALTQAQTFRDEGRTFGLITLYEQRINRNLQRNVDRLKQLQSERREARAHALKELTGLSTINRLRGKTSVRSGDSQAERSGLIPTEGPLEDRSLVSGFVFSTAESELAALRRRRSNLLAEANSPASGPIVMPKPFRAATVKER